MLVAHPKQIEVGQHGTLSVEEFEDHPIDVQRSLNLPGHALRKCEGEGVLDVLHIDPIAISLIAKNLDVEKRGIRAHVARDANESLGFA